MTPPVRLETSGGVLSTVDMVVQRRDGPRRLRDHDGDDDEPPVDASAPTLYKYVFGPLQFAPGCHFSPGTVGSLQRFTDLLPEFKGRRKEEWGGKHGWSNNCLLYTSPSPRD